MYIFLSVVSVEAWECRNVVVKFGNDGMEVQVLVYPDSSEMPTHFNTADKILLSGLR